MEFFNLAKFLNSFSEVIMINGGKLLHFSKIKKFKPIAVKSNF